MPVIRALAVAAALLAVLPAAAGAATPIETEAATAPSYPGNTNTAAFTVAGDIVAGTLQTVDLAGHAEFRDPEQLPNYSPSVYVQNAGVDPSCAPTVSQQRQKLINNPAIKATSSLSGWVLDEGQYTIGANPPATGTDWATRTQPFAIALGVKEVLLCAYTRYVVDDVSVQATRWKVAQPRYSTTRKKVRRGGKLTLKCNFHGSIKARMTRGGKKVTRTVKIGEQSLRGAFSTKGARKGVNKLRFSLDGKIYGGALKVRVT